MRKAEIDEYIQKLINTPPTIDGQYTTEFEDSFSKEEWNYFIEKLTEISFTWTPPDEYFYKGP
ncbi:hypothetical protein ABZU09_06550 [Lactobacillus mulieris]|jgi:hypothetical protein|uniref:Uncharacterized protein n=2 Tax=root TaxID=1 RepID=A0AAP3GV62_9LACO|nr:MULTISPECIES: hypothetical protein [Lactobacillus]EEU21597.1 hypothetical protein HMPREF0525_00531 [Lactobacillus jensenii 27-2-CHN]EEX24469.1 hypothetical protein HMPREF0974_00274 [Lactobacillus jensenii 115-3-CHN]EFH29645.1 hypothetical protein HMPREF0526_11248 [Lactobacillus jensenii JV-V16]KAA9244861.1 hypothetical protein F6I33_02250 [Lactobacillus jensenii]DAD80344.1 MAG TPA: Protein of unknown function (DUF1654) [Siphoviridae sp. ctX581]DAX31945.1 MAG TPA: Protein of unknown functio